MQVLGRTNVSLGSFTNTSFTNAFTLLDRTNVSIGSFTHTSFANGSTVYWKTNVSIVTNTSYVNTCGLLDTTNTSLNNLIVGNIVQQNYQLSTVLYIMHHYMIIYTVKMLLLIVSLLSMKLL